MQTKVCKTGGQLWQVNVKIAGFMTGRIARYLNQQGLQILHARIG